MYKKTEIFKFAGDEVICWIEPGSGIMLKAIAYGGKDPVELTADEARNIAKKLIEMADKLDAELLKD